MLDAFESVVWIGKFLQVMKNGMLGRKGIFVFVFWKRQYFWRNDVAFFLRAQSVELWAGPEFLGLGRQAQMLARLTLFFGLGLRTARK